MRIHHRLRPSGHMMHYANKSRVLLVMYSSSCRLVHQLTADAAVKAGINSALAQMFGQGLSKEERLEYDKYRRILLLRKQIEWLERSARKRSDSFAKNIDQTKTV